MLFHFSQCCKKPFVLKKIRSFSTPSDKYYKLPRLFNDAKLLSGKIIQLSEQDANYIHNVMRLKNGAQIRIFNSNDGEFLADIVSEAKRKHYKISLEIKDLYRPLNSTRPNYPINLIFSPLKKEKFKLVLEKATELGAESITPLITQNTNVDLNHLYSDESIQTILIQSIEQCERFQIPKFNSAVRINDLIESRSKVKNNDQFFICKERSSKDVDFLISTLLKSEVLLKDRDSAIYLVIGPEGGFTTDEFEALGKVGKFVSLGEGVLRAETASIASLSIVSNWFDHIYNN